MTSLPWLEPAGEPDGDSAAPAAPVAGSDARQEDAHVLKFPKTLDSADDGRDAAAVDEPRDEPIDAQIVARRPGTDVVLHATVDAAEVIDHGDPDSDEPGTAIEPWRPGQLAQRVAALADRPLALPIAHMRAAALWWAATLGRRTLWCLLHPWQPIGAELRPIAQGVRVSWRAWRDWVTVADLAAAEREIKDGPGRAKLSTDREQQRRRRRKISALLALLAAVAAVVSWFAWPTYLILAALGLAVVIDVTGRKNPDPEAAPPVRRRTMLEEGAPLGSLTTTILERFEEEGLRVDAADRMQVFPGGEYRLQISHEDAIEPKHLRSLERHVGALVMSIRCVASERGGTSELRLPTRDYLKGVGQREWAETGSRSVAEPAPLWFRSDGDRSSPLLSGVHIDMIGITGAGKSEGLQEIISFFGECRDVYPVFIDLTRGPLGPLNKRVLRRHAYSVEDAEALLLWALERVEERHQILYRLAESDDPDDDDAEIEWNLAWGPEIKIIIDEYSFVALNNGERNTIDLHGLVEHILRVGRKVKVTVLRASQRSGNADLGSTVAAAQIGLKILMACTERDTTTMLSVEHRNGGWSPHWLRPAVKGDVRDAGKCFVFGPAHRDPEIHRFHSPRPPGEIKRTDRQRAADGLPNLDGTPPGERPAVLLSPIQVAVEEIFVERGAGWLPTAVLLAELAERGQEVDSTKLADELAHKSSRSDWEGRQARGYRWTDVQQALGLIQE
jgi:hypothetical protein